MMRTLPLLLALLGCSTRDAPPPGYRGPLPSVEARQRLAAVRGREVPAGAAGVEGTGWVVNGFLVGAEPYIVLRRGEEWHHIVARDDAAVDAFLRELE